MTPALALFYAAAAITLGAALQMIRSRETAQGLRWFALAIAGIAAVEFLLLAPWVAIATAFVGACGFAIFSASSVGAFSAPDHGGRRRRSEFVFGSLAVGLLAWIFVGTWGRQLAFPGHDLAPGTAFSGLRQLATSIASEQLTLSLALPLLLFIGALGALALFDREGDKPAPAKPQPGTK
ncbi:MAG TPA: hypothetical protein ENK31_03220 [Nannocystis exedens]|nr:hypothetical protein [Nannocystis exedens]